MSGVIKGVLFDLDGTLLDTAQDFHESLNQLRAEENLAPLSFETVRAQVSHGGHALVRLGFGTLDPEPHEAMRMRLLNIYRKRLAKYTRLFEGGEEMLGALERRGLAWGIVTNKPGFLTTPLLATLGLDRVAGCVVSGDTLPQRKPHPAPLLLAASQLSIPAGQCLYVGDAERDVQASRAAGMPVLVALYGYLGPDDNPTGWQADAQIDTPTQIIDWLDGK